jgi:hypothetical protein
MPARRAFTPPLPNSSKEIKLGRGLSCHSQPRFPRRGHGLYRDIVRTSYFRGSLEGGTMPLIRR